MPPSLESKRRQREAHEAWLRERYEPVRKGAVRSTANDPRSATRYDASVSSPMPETTREEIWGLLGRDARDPETPGGAA